MHERLVSEIEAIIRIKLMGEESIFRFTELQIRI